jgi:hypothetical protein
MKERPILFSTPMVQSIMDGTKTQTRRALKGLSLEWIEVGFTPEFVADPANSLCPYGQVGDVLWVRETWQHLKCLNINPEDENYGYVYKADGQPWNDLEGWRWKPSIFMPKEACRLMLKITDIRVERLKDISEDDSKAEGIGRWIESRLRSAPIHYQMYSDFDNPEDPALYASDPIDSFESLWRKINGKDSWVENPWVWVIIFEKI